LPALDLGGAPISGHRCLLLFRYIIPRNRCIFPIIVVRAVDFGLAPERGREEDEKGKFALLPKAAHFKTGWHNTPSLKFISIFKVKSVLFAETFLTANQR
jgi:hypothetical protein